MYDDILEGLGAYSEDTIDFKPPPVSADNSGNLSIEQKPIIIAGNTSSHHNDT